MQNEFFKLINSYFSFLLKLTFCSIVGLLDITRSRETTDFVAQLVREH